MRERPARRPCATAGLLWAAALAIGACGGAAHVVRPAAGAATPSGRAPYRWLVATAGPQVAVAAENAAAGTRAWRLPGPPGLIGGEGHGAAEGYVAAQAVSAGDTQHVYVRAPGARTVVVRIYRMGWYGGAGGRLVLVSSQLPVARQPSCAHDPATGASECDWSPTLSFVIPRALASGVYIVKLRASTAAERDCMFVVTPQAAPRLLVQIPTATYEAYNAWGGDSLYPGGRDSVGATGATQGVEVSYDRPYESQTGAGQFFIREVAAVRFLERYGYPVGYTTDAAIDAGPGQLRGVRAFLDVGHSEYWSARQAAALAAARERGTSLLFLSSDTLAWRIRYAPAGSGSGSAGALAHRIVAYKQFAAGDPDRAEPSGLYPFGGAPLAGSAYDGCITPRVQQAGPPVYRYDAWRPDPSLQPGWLFAGTGVAASTSIPGIVGYELDERTAASAPGTAVVGGSGPVSCQAEDGPSAVRGDAAQTTLYTAPSGAIVFAAGTLGWLYGLSPVPQASPDAPRAPDPRVVAMTRNLLARALRDR